MNEFDNAITRNINTKQNNEITKLKNNLETIKNITIQLNTTLTNDKENMDKGNNLLKNNLDAIASTISGINDVMKKNIGSNIYLFILLTILFIIFLIFIKKI